MLSTVMYAGGMNIVATKNFRFLNTPHVPSTPHPAPRPKHSLIIKFFLKQHHHLSNPSPEIYPWIDFFFCLRQKRSMNPSGVRARRPRAARACELCRSKKNKCDELLPCTYCKSQCIIDWARRLLSHVPGVGRNFECIYQDGDRTRRMGYSTE